MSSNLKYFHSSFAVTFLGLIAGFGVGYAYTGTIQGALASLFLTFVLSILEVSLSFDNAVVNASVLRQMTPVWRHRFITWGMLIAVFGMRIVFPIAVVSLAAWIGPWDALKLATFEPARYAEIMMGAHLTLAGFGGSFLLMVALKYFFNKEKNIHWISAIERPLVHMGKIEAVELGICLLIFYALSRFIENQADSYSFLASGIFGMVTYVFIDGISSLLNVPKEGMEDAGKASAAMFMYLEVLDATFSFDGVIGAFALTNNLFIIAAGLGIGAMFVRSMTIMLVEKDTLSEFIYLEHGAFYAIGALAAMMLTSVFVHVPEVITGLIGAVFIGASLWSSIRHAKKARHA